MFETLVALAGLLFLILIHEWGHYAVGRMFGFGVRTFSIGFNIPGVRPIFSFKRGPTEYKIGWLLILGGYCRFVMGKEVKRMSLQERARLAAEFPEQLAMLDNPENWAERKPLYAQACVALAGIAVNLIFALVLITGINMYTGKITELGAPKIERVVAESLADQGGLRAGDQFIAINGRAVDTMETTGRAIREFSGNVMSVEVLRDGEHLTLIVPASPFQVRAPIGVVMKPNIEQHSYSAGELLEVSATDFVLQTTLIAESFLTLPQRLYETYFKSQEDLALEKPQEGTGMFSFIGQMGSVLRDNGWLAFIATLATLNIFLALFNLLPIPMLDGGLLVYLFISRIAGYFGANTKKVVTLTYNVLALLALFLFLYIFGAGLMSDIGSFFGRLF